MRGSLEAGQIKAIQHLAASAVEGLKPGRVSIVDETGQLLATGRGDDAADAMSMTLDERSKMIERRTQRDVEKIVASVVGAGRVRVSVSAEIDYNKITETSNIFDPEGQVVRSTQSREENSSTASATNNEGVTVGNELPAANAEDSPGAEQESASKTEEVVNYEISKTTKTEVVEGGRIKRLSVAVLVDGIYQNEGEGKFKYTPRSDEELQKISTLVRSAIGFDKKRGDQVHVANLRFAEREVPPVADKTDAGMFEFTKAEYFYIAELVVIGLISLLVLVFVVRPLVRRIVTPEVEESLEDLALEWTGNTPGQLAGDTAGQAQSGKPELLGPPPDTAASAALKNAKMIGEIQANTIREVGEVVENNPEEAVNIVRNWISEPAVS